VALLCTGSELRQPGETLGPGQIWNANRFALLAAGVCGSLNLTMPAIFLRLLEKVRPAILADPPVSEFWRFKS
jgi:hypothetical protein